MGQHHGSAERPCAQALATPHPHPHATLGGTMVLDLPASAVAEGDPLGQVCSFWAAQARDAHAATAKEIEAHACAALRAPPAAA